MKRTPSLRKIMSRICLRDAVHGTEVTVHVALAPGAAVGTVEVPIAELQRLSQWGDIDWSSVLLFYQDKAILSSQTKFIVMNEPGAGEVPMITLYPLHEAVAQHGIEEFELDGQYALAGAPSPLVEQLRASGLCVTSDLIQRDSLLPDDLAAEVLDFDDLDEYCKDEDDDLTTDDEGAVLLDDFVPPTSHSSARSAFPPTEAPVASPNPASVPAQAPPPAPAPAPAPEPAPAPAPAEQPAWLRGVVRALVQPALVMRLLLANMILTRSHFVTDANRWMLVPLMVLIYVCKAGYDVWVLLASGPVGVNGAAPAAGGAAEAGGAGAVRAVWRGPLVPRAEGRWNDVCAVAIGLVVSVYPGWRLRFEAPVIVPPAAPAPEADPRG